MTTKEKNNKTDGQQQTYQENMLKIVLKFGGSNTEFGATFSLMFANKESLKAIQDNFGFLLDEDPIEIKDKLGGIQAGGYQDWIYPTELKDVYFIQTFTSEEDLEQGIPHISLAKLDFQLDLQEES